LVAFSGDPGDLLAIRHLLDDYADAVFRRDADAWAANWTEDCRWHLMGTEVVGRAAVRALWEQAMQGFTFVAFFAQPGAIVVNGDEATGRVYTHEVLEALDGTISRPVGRYDDTYRRRDGRWSFAERKYQLLKG
jgi:uncharacterized protein (TIGR02246 family)